jgi:hypothetical protein
MMKDVTVTISFAAEENTPEEFIRNLINNKISELIETFHNDPLAYNGEPVVNIEFE